jgi:outer membrane protein assembly factor BamB
MMKIHEQQRNDARRYLRVLAVASMILIASVSHAQQWTRFRGPNGQGVSYTHHVPVKWTPDDYNWKLSLPGGGHSSPVLWDDKVFITSGDLKTDQGFLLAVRVSDGKILWRNEYPLSPYRPNSRNSYASATPAVDADHIYVLWPTPEETILMAVDHNGEEIWKRVFEGVYCQHGAGGSPIVFEDIVVFTHEHENSTRDAPSSWVAVDRKTGQTRWQLKRQTGPKTSYSTPCIYTPHTDEPQLIFTSNSHGITGVNPRSGTMLWQVDSVFPARVVSSPVIAGGLLIGSCGDGSRGKCLVAVQPGSKDNSFRPSLAYTVGRETAPYVPTSIANEGLLFTFHDSGYVCCLRSATGEQLWREKPAGKFFGSPVWVSGTLYCITTSGDVVVVEAAPAYELLAVNPLGERSHSTPAVKDGRIYLRTYSHLISVGPQKY